MVNQFSVCEGEFGRVELIEYSHDLVVHAHSQPHVMVWLGGGLAHAHIAGEKLNFTSDMVLYVNSFVSHNLCLDDAKVPAIFLMIYIENDWLEGDLLNLFNGLGSFQVIAHPQAEITHAADEILLMLSDYRLLKSKAMAHDMEELVNLALRALLMSDMTPPAPYRRRMIDYRLRVAIAHMLVNLDNPKVADELAELVGLSRSRFYEIFQNELQSSPHVYWNALRAEEAAKRLSHHNENMTDVAFDLGFSSPGNFSRFFRGHTGVSPSTYRRVSHVD